MSEADGRTPDPGRAMNGGQALVGVLEHLGVDTIFGLCGDTSLPWYEALATSPTIRHILTRDERSAAFMADAYARLSGRVGVCEGPSGGVPPTSSRGREAKSLRCRWCASLRHRHHRAGVGT